MHLDGAARPCTGSPGRRRPPMRSGSLAVPRPPSTSAGATSRWCRSGRSAAELAGSSTAAAGSVRGSSRCPDGGVTMVSPSLASVMATITFPPCIDVASFVLSQGRVAVVVAQDLLVGVIPVAVVGPDGVAERPPLAHPDAVPVAVPADGDGGARVGRRRGRRAEQGGGHPEGQREDERAQRRATTPPQKSGTCLWGSDLHDETMLPAPPGKLVHGAAIGVRGPPVHCTAVRVDQVIPSLASRDAIGVHTLNLRDGLRAAGIGSDVFYGSHTPDVAHEGRPVTELGRGGRDRWLLYQASIGSPVYDILAARSEPKLVNYHNITPAALLRDWEPAVAYEAALGSHAAGPPRPPEPLRRRRLRLQRVRAGGPRLRGHRGRPAADRHARQE